ncbi:hypothetical protein RSX31_11630 [Rossellomorea sp. YC4-1]|nr:hypothetical protein [Rossellomorea sp. YC4-1]
MTGELWGRHRFSNNLKTKEGNKESLKNSNSGYWFLTLLIPIMLLGSFPDIMAAIGLTGVMYSLLQWVILEYFSS